MTIISNIVLNTQMHALIHTHIHFLCVVESKLYIISFNFFVCHILYITGVAFVWSFQIIVFFVIAMAKNDSFFGGFSMMQCF